MMRLFLSLAAPALAMTVLQPAPAVTVLCSTALRGAMLELVPQFERDAHQTLAVQYGTSTSLKQRIDKGEAFDLVILTPELMDELMAAGKIARDTRTAVAQTPMAIGIRAGARKPDVRTVDALKATLMSAKSLVYAKAGAAGLYFTELAGRLGIADALKARTMLVDTGEQVGEAVADGHAELGILPMSEIVASRGVEIGGTFPREVQKYAVMVAGVSAQAAHSSQAKALIASLTAPAATPVMKRAGMERP